MIAWSETSPSDLMQRVLCLLQTVILPLLLFCLIFCVCQSVCWHVTHLSTHYHHISSSHRIIMPIFSPHNSIYRLSRFLYHSSDSHQPDLGITLIFILVPLTLQSECNLFGYIAKNDEHRITCLHFGLAAVFCFAVIERQAWAFAKS